MGVGDFTKEEATLALELLEELKLAIPRQRRLQLLDHKQRVERFIRAAERAAPSSAGEPAQQGDHDGEGSVDGRLHEPERD